MTDTIDLANEDLLEYLPSFLTLIGNDLLEGNSVVTENISNFLIYIRSTSSPASHNIVTQEAYELYILAICLDQYATRLDTPDFYIDTYLPILYSAISNSLPKFRSSLMALGRKVYNHISDQAETVISFSLVLYNISPSVLRMDTQQIFLKTSFIESSPYNIEDIDEYYYMSMQYVYYTFIRSKTDGLIGNDALEVIKKEIERTSPSRYKIYETGLRAYQIQKICSKSDTLTTISLNFDKIRSNILSNNFLHIIKSAQGIDANDEKTLLLRANDSDDYNGIDLSELEPTMPMICTLLKSFHIQSDDSHFTSIERIAFQSTIYQIISYWLKRRLEYRAANKLASTLAVSISDSLSVGVYIDPESMKKIDLNSAKFTPQFKLFIEYVFDRILQRAIYA